MAAFHHRRELVRRLWDDVDDLQLIGATMIGEITQQQAGRCRHAVDDLHELPVELEMEERAMNLGHLASYHERVKTTPLDAEGARGALLCIIERMAEVDADIIKSHYGAAVETEDRPPDGYDYDLLWDHILDAINTHVRQPNYRPERDEIRGMWAKSTPSTLATARLLVSGWNSLMRLATTQTASRRT